jgi:hypothetical protein
MGRHAGPRGRLVIGAAAGAAGHTVHAERRGGTGDARFFIGLIAGHQLPARVAFKPPATVGLEVSKAESAGGRPPAAARHWRWPRCLISGHMRDAAAQSARAAHFIGVSHRAANPRILSHFLSLMRRCRAVACQPASTVPRLEGPSRLEYFKISVRTA